MNDIEEKFSRFQMHEPPFNITKRVMRRILFDKLRLLIAIFTLLLSSSLLLMERIAHCISETGAIEVLKVLAADFELSSAYIYESWQSFAETMPMKEVQLLAFNLVLVLGLCIYIYKSYKKEYKTI